MTTLIYLILIIPKAILHGWILSLLWKWFFVPTFGLPGLRLVEAIGISIVIGFFLFRSDHREEKKEKLMQNTANSFFTPFVFLGIGWIVQLFM